MWLVAGECYSCICMWVWICREGVAQDKCEVFFIYDFLIDCCKLQLDAEIKHCDNRRFSCASQVMERKSFVLLDFNPFQCVFLALFHF